MPHDPFPGQGDGGQEPDRPVPPAPSGGSRDPGGAVDPPDDPREGAEQGLFVCLPAEELTLEGFAQGGRADTMAPGPLLATVLEAVTGDNAEGLAGLPDDQLMGVLSGTRRMEARIAWLQLAALAELARRRPPGPGEPGRAGVSGFAADEVAAEFTMSWESAAGLIGYAAAVAARLPRSFAALAAGTIHPVHLRIIEDETSILPAADATRADEVLAEAAASKTFGALRSAAHRLVLKLDPDAARRRKEKARAGAHVRRFREASGNGGMIARELPSDEVLASWQHVEQRALDLRAAGVPGTLQELRVRAYLDLLQERDSRLSPAGPAPDRSGRAGDDAGPGGPGGGGRSAGPQDGPGGPGQGPEPSPGPDRGTGGAGRARGEGPAVAALVNITVPLSTVQGRSGTPGEAAGFGLLDAGDARDLVAAAARHPGTRWCVTALHPDGTAAAHGCARGRHPSPGTSPGGDSPGPGPPGTGGDPVGPDPPGIGPPDFLAGLRARMIPVARGGCGHARAEAGYQPSRALAHRVRARNTRCTAAGCGRPAARCDLDHTLAWDQGGITCECDLAPKCMT